MAKRAKRQDAVKAIQRPSRDDVRLAMDEAVRIKGFSADYSGQHGRFVKGFTERWNVDKKAFGFARALYGMEPHKREAVLIDTLELFEKLGFTDQASLFDSVKERALDVAEKLAGPRPMPGAGKGVGGDVLAAILNPEEAGPAEASEEAGEDIDAATGTADDQQFSPVQAAAERIAEAAEGVDLATPKTGDDLKLPPFLDRRGETKTSSRKRARKALDLPEGGAAGEAMH